MVLGVNNSFHNPLMFLRHLTSVQKVEVVVGMILNLAFLRNQRYCGLSRFSWSPLWTHKMMASGEVEGKVVVDKVVVDKVVVTKAAVVDNYLSLNHTCHNP